MEHQCRSFACRFSTVGDDRGRLGTPTTADSYSFTVKVTDSTTPTAQTATKSLTIAVAAAAIPVKITTTSVPSGQVGVTYSTTLAATGGTSPYSWSWLRQGRCRVVCH